MYPQVKDGEFVATVEERERAFTRVKMIEGDYIRNILIRLNGQVPAEEARQDFYCWLFREVLGFSWQDLRAGASEKIRRPLSFEEVAKRSYQLSRRGSR